MDDEELDLSAWPAPPAPSGLADRVIARVNATHEAIAVATQRRRMQRRWWIAGGIAAVLAGAALALVVVGVQPHAASNGEDASYGAMVAVRPRQLALHGTIANLDPDTSVSWQQSGEAVHVDMLGGAATWRVDDPRLFLDVGDVGAAVASIEASNATLRVETRMNLTDARLITTAAVTSAAVAFVTVAVYEGHVKLSGAGQTVVVQPGTTYAVLQGHAPSEQLDKVDRALDEVTKLVAGTPKVPPPSPPAPDKTTKPIAVMLIAHGQKWGPLSTDVIDATMKTIEPSLVKCIKKRSDGQILHFDTNPDGTVGHLYASIDDPVSNACVVNVIRHTHFPKASDGTSISYSLAPPCDADALIEAGTQAVARGAHAAGLKSYEAALDCKPAAAPYDDHTIQLTFMAACSAGNVAAARRHWKTLATETKSRLVQMCLRNHITEQQLDE